MKNIKEGIIYFLLGIITLCFISCHDITNRGKDFDCIDDYKGYLVVETSYDGFYTVRKSNCEYITIKLPELYNYRPGDTIGKLSYTQKQQIIDMQIDSIINSIK